MINKNRPSAEIVGRQKLANFCCHMISFCRQFSSAVHISKTADSSDDEAFTPVNSSHGQLVTHASRRSQLVTSVHITKPPVINIFICMPVRWHPETALNADGIITASEHTTRRTQCHAVRFVYLGLMCEISKLPMTAKLLNATNAGSKRLVTTLSDTTGNLSHDFMVGRVDWLPTFINAVIVAKEKEKQKNLGVSPRILRR